MLLNRDKLRPDGPLGSNGDFTITLEILKVSSIDFILEKELTK